MIIKESRRRKSRKYSRVMVGSLVKAAPTENDIQESVISWMGSRFASLDSDGKFIGSCHLFGAPLKAEGGCVGLLSSWAFMIPNGVAVPGTIKQRSAYVNAMKRRGFKTGVSDLFLSLPVGKYHGCYLEIKRNSKSPISKDQKEWVDLMIASGYAARVCAGYKECIAYLESYLSGNPILTRPVIC